MQFRKGINSLTGCEIFMVGYVISNLNSFTHAYRIIDTTENKQQNEECHWLQARRLGLDSRLA